MLGRSETFHIKEKTMKYCFIINPAAGKSEGKAELENKIKKACAERGIDADVYYTEGVGDAGKYIVTYCTEHDGDDIRFFACGGDGTLCEAVNGLMRVPDREGLSLGVIPVGTGNDFVRNFDGSDAFFDIGAQLDAESIGIDLIDCNGTYVINMINIGFDCQVVVKTAELKRKSFIPSKLAYICGLVLTLIKKPGAYFGIESEGKSTEHKTLLLATFANGSFCGGGFHSNPNASLCDGKINALFVNNISRTKFMGLVGCYKSGTHLDGRHDDILYDEESHGYGVTFTEPTNVSVDGEIMKFDRLVLSCIPNAINFLVPRGASLEAEAKREASAV